MKLNWSRILPFLKHKHLLENKSRILVALISGFVTFSICFRFLKFNQTPMAWRFVQLISVFVFVILLIEKFFSPSIISFLNNKRKHLILWPAIVIVIAGFLGLPYQFAPFRTFHEFEIHIAHDASPVVLNQVTNFQDDIVPLITQNRISRSEDIVLSAGDQIIFNRSMVGGLIANLSANELPASVAITWDGVTRNYDFVQTSTPLIIRTNPSSWGKPENIHAAMAIFNLLSDALTLIFLLVCFTQWVLENRSRSLEGKFRPSMQISAQTKKILLLQTVLIISAALLINAGKIAIYISHSLLVAAILLWLPMIFSFLFKGKYPNLFFFCLTVTMVLGNFFLFPNQPEFVPLKINRIGNSYNELMKKVWPSNTIALSVGFYQQLHGASLIVSQDILDDQQLDKDRLAEMNRMRKVDVQDYDNVLTDKIFQSLINKSNVHRWESLHGSHYYLLDLPENFNHEFQLYQYQDDLLLIPPRYPGIEMK